MSFRPPLVILVTGLPGTGKTILAKRLVRELGLPRLSRDTLKEALFDCLGIGDREWSKRLGALAYDHLYHTAANLLIGGNSFILESNFSSTHDSPRMQRLYEPTPFRLVQIVCQTEETVRQKRILERSASGDRHPGHVDLKHAESVLEAATPLPAQLIEGIPSQLHVLDTSSPNESDMDALLYALRIVLVAG